MCPTEASTPSGATETDGEAPVRLALLDDHGLIVDSLATWFSDNAPDFAVVVRATTWMDLIRSPEFPVDLVLMDLQLGDSVSIESRIRACRAAGAKVVVVSALDDDASRERCISAGAAAFVSKTMPADQLVDLARRVARGERLRRRSTVAGDATDAAAHADATTAGLRDSAPPRSAHSGSTRRATARSRWPTAWTWATRPRRRTCDAFGRSTRAPGGRRAASPS